MPHTLSGRVYSAVWIPDRDVNCGNSPDDRVNCVNFDRQASLGLQVPFGTGYGAGSPLWEASMVEVPVSLAEVLRLAGWGPRQLVTAINSRLSSQGRGKYRLDPTAAYPWVKQGYRPRPPVPDIAAAVLSEHVGYLVTAAQLWPGRDGPRGIENTAADNFDTITCIDDLLRELNDLTTTATASGGRFVGASGADLTAAVLDQLRGAVLLARHRSERERVPPQQVELIASHVAALRRLDDRHGGGALSLRYVGAELRSVIDLVEYAKYEPKVGRQLLTIVADLAQLLGWLQFDSDRYGAAERYLLLSVGVCRSLEASDRAANAIGMLGYVSAFAGHGVEALRLVDAAVRECGRPDPILRARMLGREATAAAADGDLDRFRRASDTAMQLLMKYRHQEAPSFLYYLAPEQLAAESGQGLVVLAERTTASRKRLLTEAIDTLTGAVAGLAEPTGAQQQQQYPRSALLHSTFLAKAHLMRGDLEQGVVATRHALGLLDEVQSPRGRTYLRALLPALARRARSRIVADLLPEFDRALLRT